MRIVENAGRDSTLSLDSGHFGATSWSPPFAAGIYSARSIRERLSCWLHYPTDREKQEVRIRGTTGK